MTDVFSMMSVVGYNTLPLRKVFYCALYHITFMTMINFELHNGKSLGLANIYH